MSTQTYAAKRPMDYGHGAGIGVDPGQILDDFGSFPNDEMLLDLGYVMPVRKSATLVGCGECGAKFISDAQLAMHGHKRHAGARDRESRIKDMTPETAPSVEDIESGRVLGGLNAERAGLATIDADPPEQIAEEKMLEETAPIQWDKTSAARGVKRDRRG